MKRILKIAGLVLGSLVLLAGAGAAWISAKGIPTYQPDMSEAVRTLQVPRGDSALVARGQKIAALLCKECHRAADGSLTGKPVLDSPKEFGHVVTYNITQDSIHGVGAWTDGELYYFLRTGIRKDGSWAPIFMPKFPTMADQDLYAVIAWLRSDDPSLQPDSRELPPNKYNFLMKLLSNVAFGPPPMPAREIVVPDSNDVVAYGRYLADGLTGCYACHSADFKTINILEPEKSEGYYGGGNPMLNNEGALVPTANITMDEETGIGKWTEAQFVEAVRYCKKPNGGLLSYPMFPHTTLTDGEVRAIYAYLKTVPKIKKAIPRYIASN